MSNIKRTVERENLSAVFFCEFFHSKIVYMEEKIREGCGSDQGRSQNAVRSRSHILDVCASVEEDVEVETLKWMIDLVQEVSDTPICIDSPSARSCVAAIPFCKRPVWTVRL